MKSHSQQLELRKIIVLFHVNATHRQSGHGNVNKKIHQPVVQYQE